MLMQYPIGMGHSAMLTDNSIDAKISFFEHNKSRRAYCGKVYGELMTSVNYNYRITGNEGSLQRNETSDYTRELRPETCGEPDYQQTDLLVLLWPDAWRSRPCRDEKGRNPDLLVPGSDGPHHALYGAARRSGLRQL